MTDTSASSLRQAQCSTVRDKTDSVPQLVFTHFVHKNSLASLTTISQDTKKPNPQSGLG